MERLPVHTDRIFGEFYYFSEFPLGHLSNPLVQNPDYLKEKLYLRLDSLCLPDRGTSENVSED